MIKGGKQMTKLIDAKRIVIKVGTSTLTHPSGLLNIRRIEMLVKVLSDLKNAGKQIILVTSGAIGVGAGKLSLKEKPKDIPTKQACAALGQSELMYIYDKYFSEYKHHIAQILLTRDNIDDISRKVNIINTFEKLLELNVIPIVNENDTVSTEEIEFGDNDTLSAIVACIIEADLLLILSDIDGLYNKDPNLYDDAVLIKKVTVIDDSIKALASSSQSQLGTGGMITKIQAAQLCMEKGIDLLLVNGANPNTLYQLMDGYEIGTLFDASGGDTK